MSLSIQSLLASSVQGVLLRRYPQQCVSLCHAHAIVGANLISILLNRVYRPVAGLAVFDCGGGMHLPLLDDAAFEHAEGGAFHCWIESADDSFAEKEVIDLTFRHNRAYAERNGYIWQRQDPPDFLWGPHSQIVIQAEPDALPRDFRQGTVWLRETDAGWNFMTRHLHANMNAYVKLTADAIQELQQALPEGSRLLEPLITPRPRQSACEMA